MNSIKRALLVAIGLKPRPFVTSRPDLELRAAFQAAADAMEREDPNGEIFLERLFAEARRRGLLR